MKKFFEQKLIKAKKTADRDLANFIATTEEKATSDAKNGAEGLINKLKDTALAIRDSDAETLQNGKLRDGVRSAWECMWRAMNLEESSEAGTAIAVAMSGAKESAPPNPQAAQIKMLSTKLLWILSKVKHRTDYLVQIARLLRTKLHGIDLKRDGDCRRPTTRKSSFNGLPRLSNERMRGGRLELRCARTRRIAERPN